MIGNSGAFKQAICLLEKIARHEAPILIQGGTATGKELAARAIHDQGRRAANGSAIPDTLIENEPFEHDRGASSDAGISDLSKALLLVWFTTGQPVSVPNASRYANSNGDSASCSLWN